MRVTTELWVSAMLRRVFSAGAFGAIERKGAAEAGAVFVRMRTRDGELVLFGPAPQHVYDEDRPDERAHVEILREHYPGEEIERRIEREIRYDPDLWLIELEADPTIVHELLSVRTP